MESGFLLSLVLALGGCALAVIFISPGKTRLDAELAPSRNKRRVISIGAAIMLMTLLSCSLSDWLYDQVDSSGDMHSARHACHYEAEAELKKPLTAKHPSYDDEHATRSGDVITVVSWVDAEDNSGAMVRHPYTCVVTSSSGVTHLVSFAMK